MLNKFLTNSRWGYTLVELMMIVAITGLISGISLASYKSGAKTRDVKIASDNLQSALRSLQNRSLSGVMVNATNPSTHYTFTYLTSSPRTFQSHVYGKTTSRLLETLTINSQVSIANMRIDGSTAVNTSLVIYFYVPYGQIQISADGAPPTPNHILTFDVQYGSSTVIKRTVTVDGIAGRINVR